MARTREPTGPTPPVPGTVTTKHASAAAPTLEIANAIAAVYKDALGCGPTKARVHYAPPATLVVVLENTLTREERTLAALGEDRLVRERRLLITTALEDRLRSIVERALGRGTVAFLSGIDTRRDVAVEVFTLAPESAERRAA